MVPPMRFLLALALACDAFGYAPIPSKLRSVRPARTAPLRNPVLKATATLPSAPNARTELPSHPAFVRGRLENGLEYVILPNASPEGRFEAHLEVFSGSADEREDQQGIAHLVEHVAYMGSRKRERLFGTGSQTNAYTDFHHTVFYACCPGEAPTGTPSLNPFSLTGAKGADMMPRALDALCEVLQAQFLPARVEKERAAVLSEMSMVNTIEYRVECQILRTLHAENALARRFPIGLEEQIKAWTTEDVMRYHAEHYRPDNALLYIVGDVVPADAEAAIRTAFDGVAKPAEKYETGGSLKMQSRHFPPVVHTWSGGALDGAASIPVPSGGLEAPAPGFLMDLDVPATAHPETNAPVRAHVFQHELLRQFSFHLFAKRPVEAVTTLEAHRTATARRVVLSALQVRLNVLARAEPLFSFVEFQQLDSAREACSVTSLDMTGDASRWEEAVASVITESRRMGTFGLTNSELERFGAALVTDSEQLAAMGDQLAHGEQLTHLMETVACDHTFMDPATAHAATVAAVEALTLEECNAAARDLMQHVVDFGDPDRPLPSAMIACAPATLADGTPVRIDTDALIAAATRAAAAEIAPEPEMEIPASLMERSAVEALVPEDNVPRPYAEVASEAEAAAAEQLGVRVSELANGARLLVKRSPHEAQRGALRLTCAGGRDGEANADGAAALGSRTLQEGGAFSPWSREQVELFCVDRLIMVEVTCTEEAIVIDFGFPTPAPKTGGCSGVEAALQLVHKILAPGAFLWEADALERARTGQRQATETSGMSMEGKAQEELLGRVYAGDGRFAAPSAEGCASLTLDAVRDAVMRQLDCANVEISVVGDFDAEETERLAQLYVGSVERASPGDAIPAADAAPSPAAAVASGTPEPLRVNVDDTDPRAIAYVAGGAPNRLGVLADGRTLVEALLKDPSRAPERWRHPLFPAVALALVQEVANRRLFSVVRERKQLTYDANFKFSEHERLGGGHYLISCTASPANAEKALAACRETLQGLVAGAPPTPDNLEAARRVLINRHAAELASNTYWCERLTGTTFRSVPQKTLAGLRDYAALAEAVTAKDLAVILKLLDTSDDKIHTCIARSGKPGAEADIAAEAAAAFDPDEHGRGDMSNIPGRRR